MSAPAKIVPSLWYAKDVKAAAAFYTSVFPGSSIDRVTVQAGETPSGPEGSVIVVELTLFGQQFQMMEAGPLDRFNHAVSFSVMCEDQAELDRYWGALLEGGKAEQCGWLKDRFGVSWQIVPRVLNDLAADEDRARARRVTAAMLKMVKLDIAGLQRAYAGDDAGAR